MCRVCRVCVCVCEKNPGLVSIVIITSYRKRGTGMVCLRDEQVPLPCRSIEQRGERHGKGHAVIGLRRRPKLVKEPRTGSTDVGEGLQCPFRYKLLFVNEVGSHCLPCSCIRSIRVCAITASFPSNSKHALITYYVKVWNK